ncbi:hypothetical protein [Algoriphagus terrigena]|uniref:hypothetical protein n=1 Tax=Algoriphagus terrigena TaxID=344884 RepID=UPI0004035756|nr:hypothetical protein [Algoriphagus terrigena]
MLKNRIVIYPKDVVQLTGRSERYSQKLINKIKETLKKAPHQFVTLDEFAEFVGIPKDDLKKNL